MLTKIGKLYYVLGAPKSFLGQNINSVANQKCTVAAYDLFKGSIRYISEYSINGFDSKTYGSNSSGDYPLKFYIPSSGDPRINPTYVLGTGDTPVSENDQDLANRINNSSISSGGPTKLFEYDDVNKITYTHLDYTITNSTNSDVIIKEFGKIGLIQATNTQGSTSSGSIYDAGIFLLSRDLLGTPLTIPANGSSLLRITEALDLSSVIPVS